MLYGGVEAFRAVLCVFGITSAMAGTVLWRIGASHHEVCSGYLIYDNMTSTQYTCNDKYTKNTPE